MQKNLGKILNTLLGIIIILFLCITVSTAGWFSLWLRTYRAFTHKELVAVIETSELKDRNGVPYFDLTYKQVKQDSSEQDPEFEFTETYEINGDRFELGGEFVKWNDWTSILGLDPVYKVSRLEGDFSEIDLEKSEEHSAYALNGGVDNTWKFFQENEDAYSFVVDSVFVSFAGKFADDERQEWGLYVTEDAFIVDRID